LCEVGTNMINMELYPNRSGNESEFLLLRNTRFLIISKWVLNKYNDRLEYLDYDRDFAEFTTKIVEFSLKTII
jgi:hypothetical protein